MVGLYYFNPRPPWGGRLRMPKRSAPDNRFQSTPSVGRATLAGRHDYAVFKFQSTPSVGRATRFMSPPVMLISISIHALRGEGDNFRQHLCRVSSPFQSTPSVGRATFDGNPARYVGQFQSTPSVGRATYIRSSTLQENQISIHALRGEGDMETRAVPLRMDGNFNPRPPWGGRHRFELRLKVGAEFQSTPSVGRATM